MKRIAIALLGVLLLAAPSFAGSVLTQELTAGKTNGDSLGTAADTLTAFKIPSDLKKLVFHVVPDTADVLYTVELSWDNSVWATAFIDTAVAGAYDLHELGAATGTGGGYVANVDYGGVLPGKWVRIIADNLDVTIDYCELLVSYHRD